MINTIAKILIVLCIVIGIAGLAGAALLFLVGFP